MHCLFLGIAKWIVKRIWVDEKVLKLESLKEIQKKMNQFQVLANVNRILEKVECREGLNILDTRPSVGSISETDKFTSGEMIQYLLYSQNIKESLISGYEAFSGEMLGPSSEKVVMSRPEDSIAISVRMNQFRRYRIGSKIFSSKMSSRHIRSSFVITKFITDDDIVDSYPSQVQYFFKHMINLPNNKLIEHFLAYI
ncbi:hypothetical protein GLOIN_2v1775288 [Rhizophagus clarus]|uniref:Uncharacterized protein n=1 Tax=Rhizophagus clarus TaxID=94130 RepID=A0A8H3KNV1_9GLOM|nr:hypothetical protein GLOIN_2v1775288 [Rhizophagus clarus]